MLHTFFMLIEISEYLIYATSSVCWYVTKHVIYKTCSPVMYQLRVRTADFISNKFGILLVY